MAGRDYGLSCKAGQIEEIRNCGKNSIRAEVRERTESRQRERVGVSSMSAEELKIVTEARDMALSSGYLYCGRDSAAEDRFLFIAQTLDQILRPELIAELRNWPRP
jgi:hypothetical protein